MCVGSNPTPVTKRFEHNKAEPSVDKFCHTGTLIQDDSPKQKTKKIATSSVADSWAAKKCKRREDTQPRQVKHESTRGFERKSFQMDDKNRLAE